MPKILVVDNDLDTLETICLSLEAGGFKVIRAEGGQKALNLLKTETPDLILLDIMMPEIDGIQVAKKLDADIKTQKIPIMFISALPVESNNFKSAIKETENLKNIKGAVEKPFKFEDLINKINQVLKNK
ncbi:MAG: response regulator [Candidatus Parcubacteria bacterium]|nr:response regulator [Candidatus Parcubacteria bacterium]